MVETFCPVTMELAVDSDDSVGDEYRYGTYRIKGIAVEDEDGLVRWLDESGFWRYPATVTLRMRNGRTIVARTKGAASEAKG